MNTDDVENLKSGKGIHRGQRVTRGDEEVMGAEKGALSYHLYVSILFHIFNI